MFDFFKKYKSDLLAICTLSIIILAFFLRFFIPEPSIFITPEWSSSDILNFNMPVKYFLAENLKRNEIPLWTKDIGTGFPILAESQIGTFFIINLFLFKYLPFWLAFDLGYILSFFIAAVGMYFLCRYLKLSYLISFLAGIIFAFSGFFIGHIQHYNMIQAASLLPWLVLITYLSLRRHSLFYYLLFIVLMSQEIFIGHTQITFIILCLLFLLPLEKRVKMKQVIRDYLVLTSLCVISLIVSAVQVFPTIELIANSVRSNGFGLSNSIFNSFSPLDALYLLNPFIFGRVSDASYASSLVFQGRIFWENVIYLGILSPFLLFIFLFLKRTRQESFYFFVLILFSLLMLGKHSPLYIIFSIFPFSLFRVTSRFNLVFVFTAVLLLGFIFQRLRIILFKKLIKIEALVMVLIIIIYVSDFFINWFFYHPVYSQKKWFGSPETAIFLKNEGTRRQGRILSLIPQKENAWYSYSTSKGWKDKEPFFYFRNQLPSNQNILWDISSYGSYVADFWTPRQTRMNNLLYANITYDQKKSRLFIGKESLNMINLNSIQYIISTSYIEAVGLKLRYETQSNNEDPTHYKIYENINYFSRARMAYSYEFIQSFKNIDKDLLSDFPLDNTVFLEDVPPMEIYNCRKDIGSCDYSINWNEDNDKEIKLTVNTASNGILLLSDSYYPGWKAYVDSHEEKIFPANINQRAIFVRAGNHIVTLKYLPASFNFGFYVSACGYILICVGFIFLAQRIKKRIS